MDNFIKELKNTLQNLIEWSEAFKGGDRNFEFDIDDELFHLSENHNKNFKEGLLCSIYNLVDYYCDAIKHDFDKIGNDYPVTEAHDDIINIIRELESCEYEKLNLPVGLEEKIKKHFDWIP